MGIVVYPESFTDLYRRLMKEVNGADVLKRGRTDVYHIQNYTVKITRIARAKKSRKILYLLGPSKGKREFRNLMALKTKGFSVPEPIFYWENRCHGFVCECGLVEKFLENATPLRKMLKEGDLEILKPLGILFRKLHDSGFFMRDLTYGNFLVADKIYLIDVSRMIYLHAPVPFILRLEDLSKVDSTGDQLLQLLNYYWKNPGVARFSAKYIERRKLVRRYRKRITHALGV